MTKGEIPNPNSFRIFEDTKVEETVMQIRSLDEFEAFMLFNLNSNEVLKCTNCSRLWIDYNSDSKYTSYLPE